MNRKGKGKLISTGWECVAFVKAAARDVKAYLRSKNIDALVGYSSVDGEPAFRGESLSGLYRHNQVADRSLLIV